MIKLIIKKINMCECDKFWNIIIKKKELDDSVFEVFIERINDFGSMWDDVFPHEVYNMSDDIRVCIFLDIARTFDNKLIDIIFKNMIKLTPFAKAVRKINESYEKKPKALDDFPKYNK